MEKLVDLPPKEVYAFGAPEGDTLRFEPPFYGEYLDFQSFHEAGEHYWAGLRPEEFRLDVFSLDSKQAVRAIEFESEGPNGVKGYIDGFFYHNRDSIFLLSIDANQVYLMNDQARLVDLYDFNDLALPDGFDDYDVYADEGLQNGPYYVASNKTLQLYTYRWTSPIAESYEQPVFASYSIEERQFISAYGSYPPNYKAGTYHSFYESPIVVVADTITFIQFGASAYLAAYSNVTGELLRLTDEHSKHWPGGVAPLKQDNDMAKEQDWLVQTPAYAVLLLDRENELIYQVLKHKQPLGDIRAENNNFWFGPWSLTIFNYNLQQVGYAEFPKNTFLPVLSFTSAGELWVKNPVAPDKEDHSLFYRMKLTEKAKAE